MSPLRASLISLLFLSLAATTHAAGAGEGVVVSTGSESAGGAIPSGEVVAQAGSLSLTGADIRSLVAALPADERAAAANNLGSLEQVVRAELVRRAILARAQSKDFLQQPGTIAALDRVRDEALVRLWVASQASVPPGYPSEADIKAAYEANQTALAAPTQYRLAQIFISAPDGADPAKLSAALRKAVDVGSKLAKTDFSQLAQSESEDGTSASHGGDMGYLPSNRIAADVLAVVRTLKVGEVAGPVKTANGLHFLKLLDEKPGAVPSLMQVHDALANVLRERKESELERAYLADVNGKLGITVNQIELAKLRPALAINQ